MKNKNENGFTLIEMMIVLMIISIILLIAVPNMTQNNTVAQEKGCSATVDLLQAQVGAYQIEEGVAPESLIDIKDFIDPRNITEDNRVVCPDQTTELILNVEGKVTRVEPIEESS